MGHRVLRIPEIRHKTGKSRSSIYRDPEIRALLFSIGPNCVGALESAIDDLIEQRAKAAGAHQVPEAK
jgi:predicted DNA-binding transcriptional regulator AlpA